MTFFCKARNRSTRQGSKFTCKRLIRKWYPHKNFHETGIWNRLKHSINPGPAKIYLVVPNGRPLDILTQESNFDINANDWNSALWRTPLLYTRTKEIRKSRTRMHLQRCVSERWPDDLSTSAATIVCCNATRQRASSASSLTRDHGDGSHELPFKHKMPSQHTTRRVTTVGYPRQR